MIAHIDADVSEAIVALRWAPLTSVMLLVSAWWVKDLVFAAGALVVDLRARRVPWRTVLVGVAALLAPLVYGPLKTLIGRPRPFAQHLWSAIGPQPGSASMPSGHAVTAVAAATALSLLVPRARIPAAVLAATICLSRVYLGVHFMGDVLAGAALGAVLGWAVVTLGRRALRSPGR